jgi:Transmembrane amino acid transporter protein
MFKKKNMKILVVFLLLLLSFVAVPSAAASPKPKATALLPRAKANLQHQQQKRKVAVRDREIQRRFNAKAKLYQAGIPPPPTNVGGTGATVSNEVFNLVKGIVGVGVLSLPAGIAAFGSAPSALIPALMLISIIGLLSAYGFALIGKVCAYTGARSYREAWESSVGPSTAWIPAWSATLKTLLACLAYSMVLGDTFTVLLPVSSEDRNKVLVGVTTFILLPLCWMKDLKSLAPFSLLGVMGMAVGFLCLVGWKAQRRSDKFVSHDSTFPSCKISSTQHWP